MLDWKQIMREAAERHQTTIAEMRGNCRMTYICKARREAIVRMSRELGMSHSAIGRRMNCHHATVIYWLYRERGMTPAQWHNGGRLVFAGGFEQVGAPASRVIADLDLRRRHDA